MASPTQSTDASPLSNANSNDEHARKRAKSTSASAQPASKKQRMDDNTGGSHRIPLHSGRKPGAQGTEIRDGEQQVPSGDEETAPSADERQDAESDEPRDEFEAEAARMDAEIADEAAQLKSVHNIDDNADGWYPATGHYELELVKLSGTTYPERAEAYHKPLRLAKDSQYHDGFFLQEADKGVSAIKKTRLMQILNMSHCDFCMIQGIIRKLVCTTDVATVRDEPNDEGLKLKDIDNEDEIELQEYPLIEFVLTEFKDEHYFDKLLQERNSARYIYITMALRRIFEAQRMIVRVHDDAIEAERLWSPWTIAKPILEEATSVKAVEALKLSEPPQKFVKFDNDQKLRILLAADGACLARGANMIEVDFRELTMIFKHRRVDWEVELPRLWIIEQAYEKLVLAIDENEEDVNAWTLAWYNPCTPFGENGFIAIDTTQQAAHAVNILRTHYTTKVEYLTLWLVRKKHKLFVPAPAPELPNLSDVAASNNWDFDM